MVALFRADTSSLDRGGRNARATLDSVETAAADATRGVNTLGVAVDRLGQTLAGQAGRAQAFAAELRSLSSAVARLNRVLDPAAATAYADALGRLDGVGSSLAVEMGELQTELRGVNRAFGSQAPANWATRLDTSTVALGNFQRDIALAQQQLAQFNGQLAQTRALNPRVNLNPGTSGTSRGNQSVAGWGGQAAGIGSTLTKTLTVPILAAGAASVYVSTQFETAMAKMQSLAMVGKDEAKQWSDAILRLGPEVGQSPTKLAGAMFRVASEGLHGAQAMDVLTRAGKMSATQMGKVEDLAYSLAVILHDYAGSNLTAAKASDVLVRATSVGNFTTSTLVSNLGKLLPLASAMHVPFEQVAAAIAAMTREGATVPQSVTSINSMLRTFEHPSKAVYEALHKIGLSAAELRKEMGSDLLGAMLHIQSAAKGNEVAFARVFPNVRAFMGALSILGSNAKDARAQFDEVANGTNNLGKAFGTVAQTKGFQFQQMLAQLEVTGIKFGNAIAPEVMMVTHAIDGMATALSNLTPAEQRALVVAAGLLATIGPLTSVIGFCAKATAFLEATLVRLGYTTVATAGATATMRQGILALTGAVAALSAVALTFGYIWNRMITSAGEELQQFADRENALARMPIGGDVEARFRRQQRGAEHERNLSDPANRIMGPDGHRHYVPNHEIVATPAEMHQRYLHQLNVAHNAATAKGTAQEADAMKTQLAHAKAVAKAAGLDDGSGDGGLLDPSDTYKGGKVKKPKLTDSQKDDARSAKDLSKELLDLAHTVRLHGDESDAAAAKDNLLFGDMASDAQKARGLAVALSQVNKAQRDKAAHDVYGKSFNQLSPSQQQGAEVVAMTRINEARKASSKAAEEYKTKLKELNDELARGRAELLAGKATSDEDSVSLKTFQKPFSALTNPDHRSWVQSMAKLNKDKAAASVDVPGVQFDTGPDPQDARDQVSTDVNKARIELAKAHSTSDEDTISLERYGRAFKDLTDPTIIQGVRDLAKFTKDLQAAKADTSGAVFDNGADAATETAKKQLDAYRSAIHALNEAKADGARKTDAERVAEAQYGLSLAEVAGLTEDERGALMKMNDAQAVQVAQTQKYVEQLKVYREQVQQISTQGADLVTGGVKHIFDHGFKGLGASLKTELKNALQGDVLNSLQTKLKGALSGLLDKGKPKPPNQIGATTANTSAISTLTASINALIKQMGGTAPASGSAAGGASVSQFANLPGILPGGGGGAVGGVAGLLGGAFGGMFADGGYYTGPGPAMVGENGPEMFNPRGSGWFTSNDDLARGRGGGDVHLHVTYNGATTADFNPRTTLQHARQLHRHLSTAAQVR